MNYMDALAVWAILVAAAALVIFIRVHALQRCARSPVAHLRKAFASAGLDFICAPSVGCARDPRRQENSKWEELAAQQAAQQAYDELLEEMSKSDMDGRHGGPTWTWTGRGAGAAESRAPPVNVPMGKVKGIIASVQKQYYDDTLHACEEQEGVPLARPSTGQRVWGLPGLLGKGGGSMVWKRP